MNKTLLATACLATISAQAAQRNEIENAKPNIVIIYLDDLGYGDVSAYGAATIQTPNMDALAHGGVRFTDAHSTSATSTPSRYGLLTGEYPWRNKQAHILPGSAPLIISTDQMTLPKMLQRNGYHTAVVGKWHLGLGDGSLDWNKRVSPGPNEIGFDYAYIMAATQDRVPTVYIDNGQVDNLDLNDPIEVNYGKNFEGEPTALTNPEMLKMTWSHGHNNSIVNGIGRIGFVKGGKAANWVDEDMADHFLVKAQTYVREHKDAPFFLYYALQQPHVPRTPHPRFVGKSGMGPRGDVILEADWCIGEFVKTLEQEGILENTLIIFSSDNGPVVDDGYNDEAVEKLGDHKPSGVLRGGKYSLFEAGTRVPFVTYWKGVIRPMKSDALVCQMDIMALLASLVGAKKEGTDSQNTLEAFLGRSKKARESLILEASSRTAYREGKWLLIPPHKGPALAKQVNIELGNSEEYQLYNLKKDIGQQENLAGKKHKVFKKMKENFEQVK